MRNSFQTGNDTGRRYLSAVIEKGNGTAEKLTFTNNQAAFTLKKDESVDISCLPTGWTYTVTETAPGTNFEVSYSINGGSKTVGEAASFTMAASNPAIILNISSGYGRCHG